MNATKELLEKLEIDLLFEAMYRRHRYDFRHYAYDSAYRRVQMHLKLHNLTNVAELQHLILHDKHQADALLLDLSINVTEMFRDPDFFNAIRRSVIPQLQQEEHLNIWHAGCSSGEEAYSMAILLHESDLLTQTQIYATDFNNDILKKAKQGLLNLKHMRTHIQNYHNSGGSEEFASYYQAQQQHAILNRFLRDKIQFSNHNLVDDNAFGQFELIICRNVLIYFDKQLQEHVFNLFTNSLEPGGYLCLGSHETLRFSDVFDQFEIISEEQKIYRKMS